MPEPLKIGTRGSALALWQARHVKALLEPVLGPIELEIIKTSGDKNTLQPLSEIGALAGGKGLFVKEIEEALLAKRVSIAVHSGKDLPSSVTPGLAIAAWPEREDPRDALLAKTPVTLATLAPGARVGTSSLRRASQLLALRPDLDVHDLRGNVDTRVRKLDEGGYDAILLALAGLKRMGLGARATVLLDAVTEMVPAVAQGALAIETRADDPLRETIARALDHAATRSAVEAERAFLARLEGGCQLPVAAHATLSATGELRLEARIAAPPVRGARGVRPAIVSARASAPAAEAVRLGRDLAERMLADGGGELLAATRGAPPPGGAA